MLSCQRNKITDIFLYRNTAISAPWRMWRKADLTMTLLLWTASSALLSSQSPDTAGEYGENQTKINKYTIHNPLPNYKSLLCCLSQWFHCWSNYLPALCPRSSVYKTEKLTSSYRLTGLDCCFTHLAVTVDMCRTNNIYFLNQIL